MIQIDPAITHIPGFDEKCLWMMYKLTEHFCKYKTAFPKVKTLQKVTGWGRNKVVDVTKILHELGLIEKRERYKSNGGNTSNEYRITTKMVKYLVDLDGEFSLDTEELTEFENQTPQDVVVQDENTNNIQENQEIDGVLKSNTAVFENQTLYIQSIPISLNTLSIENSIFKNFSIGEKERQIFISVIGFIKSKLNGKDQIEYIDFLTKYKLQLGISGNSVLSDKMKHGGWLNNFARFKVYGESIFAKPDNPKGYQPRSEPKSVTNYMEQIAKAKQQYQTQN